MAARATLSIARKSLGTLGDAFLPQGPLGAPSHLKGQQRKIICTRGPKMLMQQVPGLSKNYRITAHLVPVIRTM